MFTTSAKPAAELIPLIKQKPGDFRDFPKQLLQVTVIRQTPALWVGLEMLIQNYGRSSAAAINAAASPSATASTSDLLSALTHHRRRLR